MKKPLFCVALTLFFFLLSARFAGAQCNGSPGLQGSLTGSNTCNGAPGLLTFHSSSGPGPFTIVYSDGVTPYTQTNVVSGVPFPVSVQPTVSTTYTLISIQDPAGPCPPTLAPAGVTAIINPGNCTLCSGSLGDPILNATFGSGNGNSPPLDVILPGASTSLLYQPTSGNPASPTPLDGYYTISSTVPDNYSGAYWHTGGKDHTGDPNGYMLYENPGASVGEFFRQKLSTLCGGGKYEFSAWIAESDDPATVPNPVLPDLTFIVQTEDGTVLDTYNSGPIPELPTWTWQQYGFFFTLPPGVSTAIVRIIDNHPGGYNLPGNDFALDDITFRPCGPVTTASLAAGGPATVCQGAQATFTGTIAAGGYANPAYLWQMSGDTGKTWTDIPGTNNLQLTVSAPGGNGSVAYQYRMVAAEAANIGSPSCRVASNPVTLVVKAEPNTDFSFSQVPCDPLQVQFTGTTSPGTTYVWNAEGVNYPFTGIGNPGLLHLFPAYGNYTVTLSGTDVCPGSTTKNVSISLQSGDIIIQSDTGICIGQPVTLRTTGGLEHCWSPTVGLDDPASANPVATPTVTTQYTYTASVTGANLLVNGDFSQGNTGFSSDYPDAGNGLTAGSYGVGPNPATWLPTAPGCGDHTGNGGNMLLVNGAQIAGVRVWSETVTVQANTNYAFSAWLENITALSPAGLKFSINGQAIGALLTANSNDCVWDQFHTFWNSGNATTAVLSIINENTALSGNDFALDDISFATVTMETEKVTVDVETPAVTASPALAMVCPGIPLTLQAGGSQSYDWSPAAGLNDPALPNPVFLPPHSPDGVTVTYTVTGTSARGCKASASVTVGQYPWLLTLTPKDTAICKGDAVRLSATGGGTYIWSPAALLDNAASATPVAAPLDDTRFYLTLIDVNSCTEQDSADINIRPIPVFAAIPDETVCDGFTVQLKGPNAAGYVYSWTPSTGLNDPAAPYPFAGPQITTTYTVHLSDSVCPAYSRDFDVQVKVIPSPLIRAEKDNDIDCSVHTARLRAEGGLSYTWTPEAGLDNAGSSSPIATLDSTTTYVVKGTGSNGCYAYDTVTVNVTATGANTFVVPNAFTPNGDGHNDCFGIQHWGGVQLQELAIYNRWGVRVFSTRNPSDCWNGRFHGQPQETGAYVYVIKAMTFCGEVTRTGVVMLIR